MDSERAKFVLGSFRANGSDVDDMDFAEALRMATTDLELGEWLVKERAFDAEFAESLARVELPDGLRAKVLLAMVQGAPEFPKADIELDKQMFFAIGNLKPPAGMRNQIIDAMERSAHVSLKKKSSDIWVKFGVPLAAAAGIAFAFIMSGKGEKPVEQVVSNKLTVDAVQAGFVNVYRSTSFRLEERGDDKVKLIKHLRSKGLPCGGMKFPPGLEHLKGLGCCELVVNGKKGSVICFNEENGMVHLIIFRRGDIEEELPGVENPNISLEGEWAKASWANDRYAYTLISQRGSGDPGRFF